MKFEVVVTLDSSERLCKMVDNLVNAGRAVSAQIGETDTEKREAPKPEKPEKPAEPEKPTRAKSKTEPAEEKPVPVNYEPAPARTEETPAPEPTTEEAEEKPVPAKPEEAKEITLEDIRRAIDETHQRIEGADWNNPESETYKKYHRKVNTELKNICRFLGYDKPSLLPENLRAKFIEMAGGLVLRDGVITTKLPF